MRIRRSARIIVGVGGVILVWYALVNGILDPRRSRPEPPVEPEWLVTGTVTLDGELLTGEPDPARALVELREAPALSLSPTLAEEFAVRLEIPFGRNPPVASVETEDSFYGFSGVPPGRYEVTATGPHGTVARRWLTLDPDLRTDRREVDLPLETGAHVLSARARTADGRPFAGYVLAQTADDPEDGEGTWTAAVEPGPEGEFEFAGFPRKRVALSFLVPGCLRVLVRGVDMTGGDMVVGADLVERSGTVTDADGTPVAGATVWVRSVSGAREILHATTTDAGGRYRARVARFREGPCEWAARAGGFEPAEGRDGRSEIDIVLTRRR
jgi:hypothetical protein